MPSPDPLKRIEQSRKYYWTHREQCNKASRKWAKNNPEKIRALFRMRYSKDPKKHNAVSTKWRKENPDKFNASRYLHRDKLKLEIMKHYSISEIPQCAKCGVVDIDCLCLDHINNDGSVQRKLLKITHRGLENGGSTYSILKKMGYPDGLQVLCANCNLKKQIELKRVDRLKNKYYAERYNSPIKIYA